MATEPDLKSLFRGIEANETEVRQYRTSLARRLESRPVRGSFTRTFWFAGAGLATAAVVIALFSVSTTISNEPLLGGLDLEGIQQLVASGDDPAALQRVADRAAANGSVREQNNARLVRALLASNPIALEHAVVGVELDPRPEVRSYYLDLLLDQADEWLIDRERVADLMDRESDPLCLALLSQMLKVASKTVA